MSAAALQWAPTALALGMLVGLGLGLWREELTYWAAFVVLFCAVAASYLLLRRDDVEDLADATPFFIGDADVVQLSDVVDLPLGRFDNHQAQEAKAA